MSVMALLMEHVAFEQWHLDNLGSAAGKAEAGSFLPEWRQLLAAGDRVVTLIGDMHTTCSAWRRTLARASGASCLAALLQIVCDVFLDPGGDQLHQEAAALFVRVSGVCCNVLRSQVPGSRRLSPLYSPTEHWPQRSAALAADLRASSTRAAAAQCCKALASVSVRHRLAMQMCCCWLGILKHITISYTVLQASSG